MELTLHKNTFSETIRINRGLGKDIEDSYAHLFTQTRCLIFPNRCFYKPIKENKIKNDGIGAFYNRDKSRIIFKTLIEYKLHKISYYKGVSQLLSYYMPIRCSLLQDNYNYEIDKFRYFEFVNPYEYCLLDLNNPEVKIILDEFSEIYPTLPYIRACDSYKDLTIKKYSEKLVPYLKIYSVDDMLDYEIVGDMLKTYYDCDIKFID